MRFRNIADQHVCPDLVVWKIPVRVAFFAVLSFTKARFFLAVASGLKPTCCLLLHVISSLSPHISCHLSNTDWKASKNTFKWVVPIDYTRGARIGCQFFQIVANGNLATPPDQPYLPLPKCKEFRLEKALIGKCKFVKHQWRNAAFSTLSLPSITVYLPRQTPQNQNCGSETQNAD